MDVASTFTQGLTVEMPRHKVAITMKLPSKTIRGSRPATRVAPTARRRSRGLWILEPRMLSKDEHF
jgi:hypothetical protein